MIALDNFGDDESRAPCRDAALSSAVLIRVALYN